MMTAAMNPDFNFILLSLAGFLFAVAVVALIVWTFKAFVLGGGSGSGSSFLKGREKRLGLMDRATIDGRRTLLLIRRDDVEHLIMIGGPVDMVIETGIRARRQVEPPLQDILATRHDARPPAPEIRSSHELRPAPDFSKS
jgi:hypothetical protein